MRETESIFSDRADVEDMPRNSGCVILVVFVLGVLFGAFAVLIFFAANMVPRA